MIRLARIGLRGGVWEGLAPAGPRPELRLRHGDRLLPPPDTEKSPDGGWRVRFRLPLERLSDGAQTFVLEDAQSGEAVASETIVAGEEALAEMRGEVALLRAELDLLKRAFRRHCAEG